MTTTNQKPGPTPEPKRTTEKTPLGKAEIHRFALIEHTFTPPHVFQLRDELADAIARYAQQLPYDARISIAEGLLVDRLADLNELNRVALAAGRRETGSAEACRDGSCDGPLIHVHGDKCGPLCACGEGR